MSQPKGPLPIKFAEIVSLTKLGVDASDIKYKNVNAQSHRFVSVRQESDNTVAIVDTKSKKLNKYPAKAIDSAIMHPSSRVIGFRAGSTLQIFNLEMKTKLKSTQMRESVAYWKWLDTKTVAIVTDSAVYHWSMDSSQSEPVKVFDRTSTDGAVQVLNYHRSDDQKWLALAGISSGQSGIAGVMQLYSVDRKASQPTIDSTAACFAKIQLDGRNQPSDLFCFCTNSAQGPKLSVIELSANKTNAFKASGDLKLGADKDFIIAMHADNKHGTLFLLSKAGFLFLYEIQSAKCIFAKRVSQATMFASVSHEETGGIVTVDQSGRIILIAVDEANLVPYVTKQLNDVKLGVQYATRYGMDGAGDVFKQQFERLIAIQNVEQAVKVAAEAPGDILRTRETVSALQSLQGSPPPVLQYLSQLLKKGKLLDFESVLIAQLMAASNSPAVRTHLTDWIAQDKLTMTEELGDALRSFDVKLACSVYLRASCPQKAVGCFLQLGEFQRILDYSASVNFTPDYAVLLSQLHRVNREKAREFASMLSQRNLVDVNSVVDLFMQSNDAESTTSFLLDFLKDRGDREEDAELQTKLIEVNLMHSPQVADAILESEEYNFTHFDRLRIAQMCERVNLHQQAMNFYDDTEDIKRVLLIGLNQGSVNPEFLLHFFADQTAETVLECLNDMLKFNMQQNIRLVVEVAKRYSEQLTPEALIEMFEKFNAHNGVYYYLNSFVNFTQDSDLVFRYIKSAIKVNAFKEVERVCRDHDFYDPLEVKEFLLREELKDPRPLIHVCDRHGFVDELTRFLYQKQMFAFIEAYVQKMNQAATPKVIGSLIDLNCEDERIRQLLNGVRPPACPVDKLVEEVLERNRLRMLLPWLEARRQEGSEDQSLHNALGMVYVETGNSPQHFLTNNPFYDSAVVGEFCESRDPFLAFVAYRRAKGSCDEQLLRVTNENGFFKDQARYLVSQQDPSLWAKVLSTENEYRRSLIDQVVATALPESRIPEEVSTTVKAFMEANLPTELIELLERIVLHGAADGEFHRNRNLQNLLILTAIKADPQRVMSYLDRLDNFDGPDIAKIAASDQYKLYEEAFAIYKKFDHGDDAIEILLDCMCDFDRAVEFAEYLDRPSVWGILARAQLGNEQTREAIASFLKADDADSYEAVIAAANRDDVFEELIGYLRMARKHKKETVIDNELLYAFAKTDNLAELEEFLSAANVAKVEAIGDRVFEEELYQAARILFEWVKNYSKLAVCYVRLGQFQAAVDAARKASNIPTWKAVCYACVEAQEFRLAQTCGVHIIIFMDHLVDLIHQYEIHGYFDQVISLLEHGVNLERAHQGIFTQLGVLYAKYKEDKLMEHIKLFCSKLNVQTLLNVCRQNLHWKEAVFLLCHYDQYENALDAIIENSAACWEHEQFKNIAKQVPNTEVYYRALRFYLLEHPLLLNDMLIELSSKLDHSRVVHQVQKSQWPLIQKYLQFVQRDEVTAVNEALNTLFVEQEDHESLRTSIEGYGQFDQIALAKRVEGHELLEFRRIAALLYRNNKRWDTSIELSKSDNLFADVISTAAESADKDLAEGVLTYFIEKGEKACYAATLYSCYNLVRPDVALELAWRHELVEMTMPFMVQTFRDYSDRIEALEHRFAMQDRARQEQEDADKKVQEQESENAAAFVGVPALGGPAPLALTAGPGMGQQGYGMYPPQQPPMNPYGQPGGYY